MKSANEQSVQFLSWLPYFEEIGGYQCNPFGPCIHAARRGCTTTAAKGLHSQLPCATP